MNVSITCLQKMFVLTQRFMFLKIDCFFKMGLISHPVFKINDSIIKVENDAVNLIF